MKKFMEKKVSIRSLLCVTLIIIMSTTMMAAAATTVKATLSPDITVKLDGKVQALKDGNGATVYPIIYNGSTYLPVRAVSELTGLPVTWEAATRTVLLGTNEVGPVSLQDATTVPKQSMPLAYDWSTDMQSMPTMLDDFGQPIPFEKRIRFSWDPLGSGGESIIFNFKNSVTALNATLRSANGNGTFTIFDPTTNTTIYSKHMEADSWEVLPEISLKGMKSIGIKVTADSMLGKKAFALYDPIVK